MNAAQKLDKAMNRVERTGMELLERAELYAASSTSSDKRWNRIFLLSAAREYANAIRHLARTA